MVGGGNRRDEGSFTVSNTNVFAALESLRKKKKSDKDKATSKGGKSTSKAAGKSKEAEEEKQVFWAPAPLTVKSWADVDDEDDDDYYATTAPPQAIWGGSGANKAEETQKPDPVEESESEDELLDEGDDDGEEEHDHEPEVQEQPEPMVTRPVEVSPAPKETERQLSKKERRKKELAELEAILADFGVNPKEKAEDEPSDVTKNKKEEQLNGDAEKKDNVPAESKSAKKKKKKDKASKELKEPQDQPNSSDVVPNGKEESAGTEPVEEDASAVDVKERLKKVASAKKKKSNKEMDAAAKAAATEAAARSAKLAAAKKKEKNHYNQQPMRVLEVQLGFILAHSWSTSMKSTTSSLNPYAASYVPLSQRGVADVNKEFNSAQELNRGNDPVWFGHQPNNTLPQGQHQNISQSYASAGQTADFSKQKDHPGGFFASTSQYPNEMPENSNSDDDMDLAYLQMTFPGISYDSLHEVYLANNNDLDAAVDLLNQLEVCLDDSSDKLPDTLDIGDVPESGPVSALASEEVKKATAEAAASTSRPSNSSSTS
ncbi:Polyadenylate-binding protein-interacting protein 6 [Sesamum alatum]|uniref:Polyadenylate-binding protein-interacting protein 6 n=1 Tax=Sesamum alatum TaxID=300844 RepID=A0AAE1Y2X0_9LAMI|nr:Polyadenylate-binding protein-interacting protein 6 [Sesamum alatum]